MLRHHPKDMPSNGEISEELARLARFFEGDSNTRRLFAMRVIALGIMSDLEEFNPRLIGSVSTGRVRRGSDIDLHIFTDSLESLEIQLEQLGWEYESKLTCIRKGNSFHEYTHVYIDNIFPVELSVCPENELRIQGMSSTDGKPIIRLKSSTVQNLIEEEHGDAWGHYLQTGELEWEEECVVL